MVTLAPVVYGKVVGRFVDIEGDGSDTGREPDFIPLSGTVTFTASPDSLKIPTAQPDPTTAVPRPIVCTLDSSGYLVQNGQPGVLLVATTDPAVLPSGFTYRVSFALKAGVVAVPLDSFSFALPVFDQTANGGKGNAVDLTLVAPVTSSAGVALAKGDKGDPGTPGAAGPVTDLTIGTVTTGTPAATITGTAPSKQLNLVLPANTGGGAGTVQKVAGVSPDSSGNVDLTPANIGAATPASVATAQSAASAAAGAAAAAQNAADAAAATANSKYLKPGAGIPKSDLVGAVQTSLGKADTATQGGYVKPAPGIPKTDLVAAVGTSLGLADTSVQQGEQLVEYRSYTSGAWQLRGTPPPNVFIIWKGPVSVGLPPATAGYALPEDGYLGT